MKKLLVICGAGMTSSIMVSKMRSYVAEQPDLDYKIGSCALNQTDKYIPQADVVFIAPHLAYLTEDIRKQYPDIQVVEITTELYSALDGAGVIRLMDQRTDENRRVSLPKLILGKIMTSYQLRALSEAMYTLLPVTVIGSIFTILHVFPVPGYQQLIEGTWFYTMTDAGVQYTMNCISLYMTFLIAYHYGEMRKMYPAHTGINAVVCFFLLLNIHGGNVDMTYFGAPGMFCAIITAFVSVECFVLLNDVCERFGNSIRSIPEEIYRSFLSLIPDFVSVVIFTGITALFSFTPYQSFPNFVYQFLQSNLASIVRNRLSSFLAINMITQILWFFGIHGGQVTGAVTRPLYMSLGVENITAFAAGKPLPNIITNQFSYMSTFGGAGSTLSLAFLMFFLAKSRHMKTLGKVSLPMGVFFINEPIILGLPIMMNPLMLVPFVAIPLLSNSMTYFLMKQGIIPYAVGFEIPWTTPIVMSGLIQGGWKLALWEIILFLLQAVFWYPFFRIQDRRYLEEENQSETLPSGWQKPKRIRRNSSAILEP